MNRDDIVERIRQRGKEIADVQRAVDRLVMARRKDVQSLVDDFGLTQREIAGLVGLSQPRIQQILRARTNERREAVDTALDEILVERAEVILRLGQ